MTKKSKLRLIDTVVIIDAHECGYWESLCSAPLVHHNEKIAVTTLAITALILESPEEGFESTTNGLTV